MHTDDVWDALRHIAQTRCAEADPAHDWLHVERVAASARAISLAEGADVEITVAAALLHELFNHPKGHPESRRSGEICAEHAREALRMVHWPEGRIEPVCYAIRVHPFSLGVTPETLEAKVLQDADRLDAIGAIGVARCFATCSDMKRPFYDPDDPLCERRAPDDKRWGVDHFYKKLLGIEGRMHTATARAMANDRSAFMKLFLKQFGAEVGR
jgi:uncharacterized protein